MLSYFNRLKSKKGFTLIEIIVVIAIMGVLLAMILPAMTGSNKDEIGKGLAKDFFYRTQDTMCELKVTAPKALNGFSGDEVIFYVEIDRVGKVIETGYVVANARVPVSEIDPVDNVLKMLDTFLNSSSYDAEFKKAITKFTDNSDSYVTSENDMQGTLYSIVDKNFTVQAAYWSDIPASDLAAAGTVDITLENENILKSGFYCCAYPAKLSYQGEVMYEYT